MEDSCITRANLLSSQFHHWLFEGVGGTSIVGPCTRSWDVVLKAGTAMTPLANGKRGPEIVEMHKLLVGTMFGVHKDFPDTVTLLNNFITRRVSEFTQAEETKHAWYTWMLTAASDGFLHLQYLPHLEVYGAKQRKAAARAAEAKDDALMDGLHAEPLQTHVPVQGCATANRRLQEPVPHVSTTVMRSPRLKSQSRLPAVRRKPDGLSLTKYEVAKPVFASRIQTPPPGLPGYPPTLNRDRPRKLIRGSDTVRDYVFTIGCGGYEHPPYIMTEYVEEPKRLMREQNIFRQGLSPTAWHSALDAQGFGPRPDSCLKYDRHMTKMFDTRDNAVHFDKHCRGNWMKRVNTAGWLRRSPVSGKPAGFRSSFPGSQPKWPMNMATPQVRAMSAEPM